MVYMKVKQCIQLIKGSLTYIYNVSLRSGVFPDECKVARGLCIKKEIITIFRIIDQYQ
jgi:hypothetical protein